MVIGGGTGGEVAVDLLDAVGHALDRLSVGDVLLDNFKTGLFIVNESDLGGCLLYTSPQDRHYPETAQDGILTTERRQPA